MSPVAGSTDLAGTHRVQRLHTNAAKPQVCLQHAIILWQIKPALRSFKRVEQQQ